ncbi:hypothetical protein JTE90_010212 [Oedothorax gibbosus]|uniref:Peptidase M13 C-terminal domain-containing protein n=1 Tax=Oedothorax gibbosus TaxID=931172 RepID=A0AAV6ULR8_9ARAC|nr:hypothetical protein JTE90_010212 [Oedothorax gibbosus]
MLGADPEICKKEVTCYHHSLHSNVVKYYLKFVDKYGKSDILNEILLAPASQKPADKVVQICEALKYFVNYSGLSGLFFDDRAYFPESRYNENILPLMMNFTQWQVANYLSLRLIISQLDVMSVTLRSLLNSSPELGSQFCVGWVSRYMSHAVAQELFTKLPSGQLEEMTSIAKTYIQEAEIYISSQKWIEESSRKQLENSIRNVTDSMSAIISYLSKPSTYDLILDNYNPTNASFLRNVLEHNKNILKFYMLHFQALQTEDFPQGFFKVAAYHSEGSIEIRFGMFLPPVYKHGLPKLLNLAAMGSAIGHEIGHEIELFFEENLNETVKKGYEEKKACLEDQFSQYEIQKIGKNVKGNQTSLENMADLIGMEITQQVIEKYNTHENFLLPALNLTTKQILYLSQAQMWCSVRSKAKEQLHYDEDVHAPNKLRVNGMMRNLPEFSKEYNCSTNSTMNTIKRCLFRG